MTIRQPTLKNSIEGLVRECYANYGHTYVKTFSVSIVKDTIGVSLHTELPYLGQNFSKLVEEINEKLKSLLTNQDYELVEKKSFCDCYIFMFKKL